jgi:hypothetical protein
MPKSLQFEVDEAQCLVDPHADGREAGQHRCDDTPCFDQCGSQQDIASRDAVGLPRVAEVALGLIRVLTAVPSSKATASSTGLGRDIRPSSPTVKMAIAHERRF